MGKKASVPVLEGVWVEQEESIIEKSEYLKSLNRYQLLIIDGLGVERDTPYVLETACLVIDEQNPADLEHGHMLYDS